jgi:transposase
VEKQRRYTCCAAVVDYQFFFVSGGNAHDTKYASGLLAHCNARIIIGDKAYNSELFRKNASDAGVTTIIPSKTNSQQPNPEFNSETYKYRHFVENLFCKLKQYRAIATRYDKLSTTFVAGLCIICSLLLL